MYYLQIILAAVLSLVFSANILSAEVANTGEENRIEASPISETPETPEVKPKQPKTMADAIRASRAKWKPLPGSHFDENYHVIVDDPEVYQKALEKEKAKYKTSTTQSKEAKENHRDPFNVFSRVYKENPVKGVLLFIAVVFVAIILCSIQDFIRDSFKKSKK